MTESFDDASSGGRRWRAPFAADPAFWGRRLVEEPDSAFRSPFQRDRDRIIHSSAFRRLKGKTQVFVDVEGDHFRTRLTHTLEVAQVARSIARPLGLDEDLTEAIALGHDLGHPPYGHAGERALDRCLAAHGGFDHNVQTLRVVTRLERRYPRFDGLNLSLAAIDGLAKHGGAIEAARSDPGAAALRLLLRRHGLDPARQPTLEAQAAAVADDIAYDAHDVEDGLRAGLLDFEQLRVAPLVGGLLAAIDREHPGLDVERTRCEIQRRMITVMIEDVVAETRARLRAAGVASADDVIACPQPLCELSPTLATSERALKALLFRTVYHAPDVLARTGEAEATVARLFAAFVADPGLLPEPWQPASGAGAAEIARTVGDYLAGMTDRFAEGEARRLFANGQFAGARGLGQ